MNKFENCTLRLEVSSRGGGIEIDLGAFGYEGEKMAAYQNYLGGGMLGAVQANDTIRHSVGAPWYDEALNKDLDMIAEDLKKYYHSLTRHEDDEWEDMDYQLNQNMPTSAY